MHCLHAAARVHCLHPTRCLQNAAQTYIKSVSLGSVADACGAFRPGDTLATINGQKVGGVEEARRLLAIAAVAPVKIQLHAFATAPVKQLDAFWA